MTKGERMASMEIAIEIAKKHLSTERIQKTGPHSGIIKLDCPGTLRDIDSLASDINTALIDARRITIEDCIKHLEEKAKEMNGGYLAIGIDWASDSLRGLTKLSS